MTTRTQTFTNPQTPLYLTARIVEAGRRWYDGHAGHMRTVPAGALHVRCEACEWWVAIGPDRDRAEAIRRDHLGAAHASDLVTGRCGITLPEELEAPLDRIAAVLARHPVELADALAEKAPPVLAGPADDDVERRPSTGKHARRSRKAPTR